MIITDKTIDFIESEPAHGSIRICSGCAAIGSDVSLKKRGTVSLTLTTYSHMLMRSRPWLVLTAFLIALIAVEAVARVLVWQGSRAFKSYRTTPLPTFWSDINPAFGVWHPANTTFRHAEQCWDV